MQYYCTKYATYKDDFQYLRKFLSQKHIYKSSKASKHFAIVYHQGVGINNGPEDQGPVGTCSSRNYALFSALIHSVSVVVY